MATIPTDSPARDVQAQRAARAHALGASLARLSAAERDGDAGPASARAARGVAAVTAGTRARVAAPEAQAASVEIGPAARALADVGSRVERVGAEAAAEAARSAHAQIRRDEAAGVLAQATRLPQGAVELLR